MGIFDYDYEGVLAPVEKRLAMMNNDIEACILSGKLYETYLKTKRVSKANLKKILKNDRILTYLIKEDKLHIYEGEHQIDIENDLLLKIKKFFHTAGVPIHIISGEELDPIYNKVHNENYLDDALRITPLGVFVPKLQTIYLAGDRIAEFATKFGISYTHLAYIVRIHEIMHWLFQWKEKPGQQSRDYEYIEESFANYMTLLWIDWLSRHINDCAAEKSLLDQNREPLIKDAIKFMRDYQPEAYAVAVHLYKECNPFENNHVLPVLNWCFQKNSIKDENRKTLVAKLRKFYQNPANYSIKDIIEWYKALFELL